MRELAVLMVDDSDEDADRLAQELARGGYAPVWRRVEADAALHEALRAQRWDVVLTDFALRQLDMDRVLRAVRGQSARVPVLVVSSAAGEEPAVESLKAGADDYMRKERLTRLCPAVDRALREVAELDALRRAENALRESEARFRSLVDSMDDVVFTLDTEGRYDGFYGRWISVSHVDPRMFLGRTAEEIMGGAGHIESHQSAVARALGGERTLYEWTWDTPDGTRTLHISMAPRRSFDGRVIGVVGVGRDITAQKALQLQLATADRMASVGILAAGVAHEINNPLAAVLANVELAQREVHDLRRLAVTADDRAAMGSIDEELRDAREASQRIVKIVRDLTLFSRAPDDKVVPVDVREVLDASLRLADNQLRHRAVLVKRYAPVPMLMANAPRLGQVFLNLLVNAAQSIPEGNRDAHEVQVVTRADERGHVVVEVRDSGQGMTDDVIARLFTPFFTTREPGQGTGLGLSISHRIVTSLGGTIVVESAPGMGSCFRVTFPAAPVDLSVPSAAPAQTPAPSEAPRRARLLVIDDDEQVLRILTRYLGSRYDVVAAGKARDALRRILDGERFDLVLCDLMMPDMTGMEFYDALSPLDPEAARAMIFLTGGAFTPNARDFLDRCDNTCVEKPFKLAEVRALIDERLERHERLAG